MMAIGPRVPVSALVLFALAAVALVPALLCFAGFGTQLHPALSDRGPRFPGYGSRIGGFRRVSARACTTRRA